MKKLTLLLAMLLTVLCGYGQALQQDFEGPTPPDLPTGWTETGVSTDGIWSVGDTDAASSFYLTFPEHTKFAYTSDDACNCDKSADRLITPSMDVSAYASLQMSFDYFFYYYAGGSFTVEASIDGGTTWTELTSLSGADQSSWHNDQVIDLSAYAGEPI